MDGAELVRDSARERKSQMPIGIADKGGVFSVFVKSNQSKIFTRMNPQKKKELLKFLWKLLTALIAALTTAIGVSACYTVNL